MQQQSDDDDPRPARFGIKILFINTGSAGSIKPFKAGGGKNNSTGGKGKRKASKESVVDYEYLEAGPSAAITWDLASPCPQAGLPQLVGFRVAMRSFCRSSPVTSSFRKSFSNIGCIIFN